MNHLESEELIGALRWTGQFWRSSEAENEKIQNEAVVLDDEGGELEASDDAKRVGVVHVLQFTPWILSDVFLHTFHIQIILGSRLERPIFHRATNLKESTNFENSFD